MSADAGRPVLAETQSPRVTHVSWGSMTVEGIGTGKDFKLYPGGGREWDWSLTGTRGSFTQRAEARLPGPLIANR
jgi:hypothetical protein